jgi:tRNA pseudouridine38-40 synthase|tara:strand:+ start:3645 stop:4385 length:741 start_codon:yes stop_codon:yes gene_type:complete
MFNYLIHIEYDGTKFVGWQYQINGQSIQETIEKSIKKILKKKIKLIGAGRTDKGVHAYCQCANFLSKTEIIDKTKFINSVNFFLKKNLISITSIKKKRLDFHSRFSAKERIYEYKIINRLGNLSLNISKAWHIKKKLDVTLLRKGSKILEGTHDFSTFRAASCSAKKPIRRINSIKISKRGDKIYIIFRSKSFLQNQVRSMMGCLKYLASKKWELKKFIKVFKSKNRQFCAPPAPAHGLYLKKVIY